MVFFIISFRFSSNAFYFLTLEENYQIMSPALAAIQCTLAQYFSGQVVYGENSFILEIGLRIQEFVFGIERPITIAMTKNLRATYDKIQMYEQPLKLLELAPYIKQKVLGFDHIAIADASINLGLTYFAMRRYNMAANYFEVARRIKEKCPESEKPTLAETYGFLGEAYFQMACFKSAIQWCLRSSEISKTTSQPTPIKVMETLAQSYTSLGIYGAAMEIYNDLLDLKPRLLPANPTDMADIIHNMGITFQGMRKFNHAIEAFTKALRLYERGGGAARVANAVKNLGAVYSQQGKHGKAIVYFQRALAIEKSFRQKELGTANTLNSIGVAYARLGFPAQAMSHYEKALAIVSTLCGCECHVDVADLFYNMAVTSSSLGYLESAKRHLKQSIRIFVACLGNPHPKSLHAKEFLKSLEQRQVMESKNPCKRSHRHGRRRF